MLAVGLNRCGSRLHQRNVGGNDHLKSTLRIGLWLLSVVSLAFGLFWLVREPEASIGGIGIVASATSFAIGCGLTRALSSFCFSLYVAVFVTVALFFPERLTSWNTHSTKPLIVPLIQVIMFGMGTMLSLKDFRRVLEMPRAVLVGMLLQFSVMPLLGAYLAKMFEFPPQVAAGVVLVGTCPGGVASNVMAYLAKGNVALSVTMTACSTFASPLVTPWAMEWLAGEYVEIDLLPMTIGIVNMVIVPIVAGLAANRFLTFFDFHGQWLDRLFSWIAMGAICLIVGIIIAFSRDALLQVGIGLILVAIVHNTCGYLLGYYGAWACGLSEADRRTVAIEVGMQNSGMATGLASNILGSTDAALAPAIFGPWMNISGSLLASFWRSRPHTRQTTQPPNRSYSMANDSRV